MTKTITDLKLLDHTECARICQQLDELQSQWIHRNPELPYYTLGAASYLDAAQNQALYTSQAERYNPVLDECFGWLFDRVGGVLAEHIGAPFMLAPEAARPGFHIFGFHREFRKPIASIHFDRQHEDVPWQNAHELDMTELISFTLPICLPLSGGGLHTWDLRWRDFSRIDGMFAPELLAHWLPITYVPYEQGTLMVHSGNLLHQIAPAPAMQPGDRRITLQGHAIKRNGVYQLYW